ncbi:MAG: MoaD/ThiS family protein [Methanobrevibacter sp.]|jgi:sulfur carrier protein|nr:MoaD/ThiS family protein [Candidatus Methanovirga aequatorialis]
MSFKLKIGTEITNEELNNFNTTIKGLLNSKNISSESVVTKKNGDIVVEDEVINNGDEIQLIRIIYGG